MRLWLACFLFVAPGARGELRPQCVRDVYAELNPNQTWLDRHSLTQSVRQAFERFQNGLDARAREECRTLWNLTRGIRANGEQVVVGQTKVTIQGMIGVGGEGVVYLAQGPQGLCSLKEFFNPREMAGNLDGMDRLAALGVPVVPTLAKDPRGLVLFQYVRGIPVDVLLSSPGINRGAQDAIRLRLQALEVATGVSLPEANVVLDPETGRFHLIDSR